MLLRRVLEKPLRELAAASHQPLEVAVLDSGVDGSHPDLRGRLDAAFAIDLDDQLRPSVTPRAVEENNDLFGHGTAVAGIITQIAPHARIVDIRVLNERNVGSGVALLAGLGLAIERGCPVINMSLATKRKFAPQLAELCERAYLAGLLVVAATRNLPLADHGFPAELSSTISVDKSQVEDIFELAYRSDHPVEFAARGNEVPVPAAGGGYTVMTGTSFATPTVAGLCALLVGAFPELRPFEVKTVLKAWSRERDV